MERRTIIIIGFLFCLIGILIAPLFYENTQYGEIFFLLIIYPIPALILATLNGYLLRFTELKTQNLILKIGIGFIPILIMILLANGKESPIQFIATFGSIGIGITDLIWITKLTKSQLTTN
ncbi:hypothetical protein ACFSYG_01940 [Leeuwenhoekiella polynyae]|uniref:Uncharacterized protein n=1 Tax=Leeuwenhoekiella polynyae TaxID=1550906 RepID=A0A4Q0NSW6_9FLAO|nr:hypothetical protein [Leeuwenhoekiella polynyae]RXG13624.1 hypothetical protein DSM02_3665 [Leeuwenhoekiella polynyae]|tara:strand:- start:67 stop:429 length:363 start_codon:yes stop_codon:yes gene_type:complete